MSVVCSVCGLVFGCLNPYSTGRYSMRKKAGYHCLRLKTVLILILLEDTL